MITSRSHRLNRHCSIFHLRSLYIQRRGRAQRTLSFFGFATHGPKSNSLKNPTKTIFLLNDETCLKGSLSSLMKSVRRQSRWHQSSTPQHFTSQLSYKINHMLSHLRREILCLCVNLLCIFACVRLAMSLEHTHAQSCNIIAMFILFHSA